MSLDKNINIDYKKNLVEKQKIIERLKNLINLDIKMNEKYLEFKELQKKWFNIDIFDLNNKHVWKKKFIIGHLFFQILQQLKLY